MEESEGSSITETSQSTLPTSAIILICIGAYLVLVCIVLLIRECLKENSCCRECTPCGKEDGNLQCCACWISMAAACNCCGYPNLSSCMDSLCGPRQDRCSCRNCLNCDTCENRCRDDFADCDCGVCVCTLKS
ncbi:uncharacterized protein [Ptychodera flava]|uniref:uncharacterized protein n=1 Tax=Ptychodera flava TaxID=63121 RepID=UPI00396AA31A